MAFHTLSASLFPSSIILWMVSEFEVPKWLDRPPVCEHIDLISSLLLSHRPELFDIYVEEKVDVVLTGHAHGGQFRLPLIGGLAAPNQGLFPKYDSGIFVEDATHMIVSRGIGNSIIPLRINNPPEIVVVKLTAK